MYTITKQFTFSASHQLEGLPDDHPCSRLHGHNYVVEVELQASGLDEVGFVQDYRDLDFVKQFIDETLDHQHLNEVVPKGVNPTAEKLAHLIFDYLFVRYAKLSAVRVSETPKTWAEYRRGPPIGVRAHQEPSSASPQLDNLARKVAALIDDFVKKGEALR
jgi:6-pyruvoyltetrahydropterin/6-carboxytetrahydropterin synthase